MVGMADMAGVAMAGMVDMAGMAVTGASVDGAVGVGED